MKRQYEKDRGDVDVGCLYFNDCFNCPFPDCVASTKSVAFDCEDIDASREIAMARAKQVKAMRDSGMTMLSIATALSITKSDVSRDLIVAKALKL